MVIPLSWDEERVSIPFGKQSCTVFRKVMSTEDTIQEFAPALRTASQVEALRISLQMLGDLCGFGIMYFDFDSTGYVKTATEVSSDNAALMRNIARHEHVLEQSITDIARALLYIARGFGVDLPHEGAIRVTFDDSIIVDYVTSCVMGRKQHAGSLQARPCGHAPHNICSL